LIPLSRQRAHISCRPTQLPWHHTHWRHRHRICPRVSPVTAITSGGPTQADRAACATMTTRVMAQAPRLYPNDNGGGGVERCTPKQVLRCPQLGQRRRRRQRVHSCNYLTLYITRRYCIFCNKLIFLYFVKWQKMTRN